MKKYIYNGVELYVGLKIKDKSGIEWEVIWCGPKRIKAIIPSFPMETPVYVSHWHFVENIISTNMYTRHLTTPH